MLPVARCGNLVRWPGGRAEGAPEPPDPKESTMAGKLAGTKTEANLKEAFAGESMARNKYTYFASEAKKEGFEQIAAFSSGMPSTAV